MTKVVPSPGLERLCLDGALLMIQFLSTAYLSVVSILAAGLHLSPVTILLAAVAIAGLQWALLRKLRLSVGISSIVMAAAFVAASLLAAVLVYDTSTDGQAYHMEAILALHGGWNPFHDPWSLSSPSAFWVQHYPKASWMTAACLYAFIPRVDVGKAANTISWAASFLAAYAILLAVFRQVGSARGRRILSPLSILLLAACLAGNPVVLAQAFTFYNDGLLGSLTLTYTAMLGVYLLSQEPKALWVAASCLPIQLNLKFTGILVVGIVTAAFMAGLYVRSRMSGGEADFATRTGAPGGGQPQDDIARGPAPASQPDAPHESAGAFSLVDVGGGHGRDLVSRRRRGRTGSSVAAALAPGAVLILAAAASFFLAGFNPYVTNTLSKGHPFYPLVGEQKVDIMTMNEPPELVGKNRLEKFVLTLTGQTGQTISGPRERDRVLALKGSVFFNVGYDTRSSGFGPMMLWITLAGAALWGVLLVFDVRAGLIASALAGTILATVFIHPECWWARYVPQLWFVPAMLVAAALCSERAAPRVSGWIVLALFAFNALGSGAATLAQEVRQSCLLSRTLTPLRGRSFVVTKGEYPSPAVRLSELGARIVQGPNPRSCAAPIIIPSSDVELCETR